MEVATLLLTESDSGPPCPRAGGARAHPPAQGPTEPRATHRARFDRLTRRVADLGGRG